MGRKFGWECKLYRNTGTYGAPTWNEVVNAEDVTPANVYAEEEVSRRAGEGEKEVMPAQMAREVKFSMLADAADEDYDAFRAAHAGRTSIEVMVLDGSADVVGSYGFRATMVVMGFEEAQPVKNVVRTQITLKPTLADNPPEWVEIEAS
jgi:hypothetical protein